MNRSDILSAAARLFATEGITAPGMAEVARAAGCSRATLYRYFPNRQALVAAFAEREAAEILAELAADRPRDLADVVIGCLAAIRRRDHLTAWYVADGGRAITAVLGEPDVIARIAGISGAAGTERPPDTDLVTWVVRVVVSFLTAPGDTVADEARTVRRFVAHVTAP